MSKSEQIRGCHHCIGTSRLTIDAIFGIVLSRAMANGGTISTQAINEAKAQFVESLPSGIDLFEKINRECMQASESAAPDPFSRDMILATLLTACGVGSAQHAFKLQIEQCGLKWLDYFFQGLAQSAQNNVGPASRGRLTAAFVGAAAKVKGNLQVSDLIDRDDVKDFILECIAPFSRTTGFDESARKLGTEINNYISRQYNITGPFIARVTEDQVKRFLKILPQEVSLTFYPLATNDDIGVAS